MTLGPLHVLHPFMLFMFTAFGEACQGSEVGQAKPDSTAAREMLPDLLDHRCRRRIPEGIRLHDVDIIHRDAQLAKPAFHAADSEGGILGQLRRHPGGDVGLAGSDGTVMNVDATRAHRAGHTVP